MWKYILKFYITDSVNSTQRCYLIFLQKQNYKACILRRSALLKAARAAKCCYLFVKVHCDVVNKRRHMFVDLEIELSVPVNSVKVELQDYIFLVR